MSHSQPHAKNLRKGRNSQIGQCYFLTCSVVGRRPIFEARHRAQLVLEAVRWLHTVSRFILDAAVVMPDHFHFVGRLCQGDLANVMHSLKSYTANRLTSEGVDSPVWRAGYHDHALRSDEVYKAKVGYVLNNPVRAGIVQQLEDYPHLILPDWWNDSFA